MYMETNSKLRNKKRWKINNNQKLDKSKSDIKKEETQHTYKPNINHNYDNSLFNQEKTIFKDPSNRSFIFRCGKARINEEEKKNSVANKLSIFIYFYSF